MSLNTLRTIAVASIVGALSTRVGAIVQEFTVRSDWEVAAGDFTTITFTEFPFATLITDQYAPLGVTFPDENDFIWSIPEFPNDDFGLSSPDPITMSFDTPQSWLAVDHPGDLRILLFNEGTTIYDSGSGVFGDSGIGFFSGIVSTEPFDEALILNAVFGNGNIDDLHFGGAVPAPGALALLGLAGLFGRTRRRRRAGW